SASKASRVEITYRTSGGDAGMSDYAYAALRDPREIWLCGWRSATVLTPSISAVDLPRSQMTHLLSLAPQGVWAGVAAHGRPLFVRFRGEADIGYDGLRR